MITSYAWTQAAGDPVALSGADSAKPSFVAPELPVELTFALVVGDGELHSDPDRVTITVRDVAPSFGDTVAGLTFTAEHEIEPLILPAATGGNGPLTYTLTSEPAGLAGLTFDPATRVLSGTPARAGRLTFTYVARDADANRELSDAAVLTFAMTVQEAPYRRNLRPMLAAFARATLYGARGAIGARFTATPASGQTGALTVAGREIPLQASTAASAEERGGAAEAVWADGSWRVPGGPDGGTGHGSTAVSVDELFGGTTFTLPLVTVADEAAAMEPGAVGRAASGAPGSTAPGSSVYWTMWGRGHLHGFGGEPEAGASYRGDLKTAWLGLEAAAADATWLAGVAVSHTVQGSAEYTVDGGDQPGERGRLEVAVTALYPYGRYRPAAGTEFSAVLGGGQGEAMHDREGAPRETSDLTLLLGSIGLRHALSEPAGPLQLALLGDAGFAHLRTGNGDQALDELTVAAGNVRVGVEATAQIPLGDAALRPFAEVAGRLDEGDDVTGAGVEVAGGLRFAAARIELEARGRLLVLHSAAGHHEYGASLTARLAANGDGRGLSAELSPRWGASATGSDVLWQDYLSAAAGAAPQPASLDGKVGYGIMLSGIGGVLTPFAELGLTDDAGSRLRAGVRFNLQPTAGNGSLAVEIGAERSETASTAPEHRFGLDLRLRY